MRRKLLPPDGPRGGIPVLAKICGDPMCRRGLLARSCRSLVSSAIAILIGLGICVSELAQTSGVPRNAFYIGLGGSYTSVNFGAQNIYAIGTSNVFQNGVLVA